MSTSAIKALSATSATVTTSRVLGTAFQGLQAGWNVFNEGLQTATSSAGVAKAALSGLWAVISAHPIIAAVAAIGSLAVAYDKLHVSAEEANDTMKNSMGEYTTSTSDLENINKELDETKSSINELYAKGSLSLVEQSELARLQKVNSALQVQSDLKEKEIERNAKQAASDTEYAYSKNFKHEISSNATQQAYQAHSGYENFTFFSDESDISTMLAGIQKYEEARKSAILQNDMETANDYAEVISGATDSIWEQVESLNQYKSNLEALPYDQLTSDQKNLLSTIDDSIEYIYKTLDPAKWKSMKLDDLFTSDNFQTAKDDLVDMAKNTKNVGITVDQVKSKYPLLASAVENAGLSVQDLIDTINSDANILDIDEVKRQLKNDFIPDLEGASEAVKAKFNNDWTDFTKNFKNEDFEILYSIKQSNDTDGWSIDEWKDQYNNMKNGIEDENPLTFASIMENTEEGSFSKSVDDFQENVSTINSAIQTFQENGKLSSSDVSDLIQQFPQLANKTNDLGSALAEINADNLTSMLSTIDEQINKVSSDSDKKAFQSLKDQLIDSVDLSGISASKVTDGLKTLLSRGMNDPDTRNFVKDKVKNLNELFANELQTSEGKEIIYKLSLKSDSSKWNLSEWKDKYIDELTKTSLDSMQQIVADTTTAYTSLSTAMSESMSATGMTADSITAVKTALSSLVSENDAFKDANLDGVFRDTADGVTMNTDAVEHLIKKQRDMKVKDFAKSIRLQNEELEKQNKIINNSKSDDEKNAALEKRKQILSDIAGIEQAQSQYNAQYQQMKNLFSDYSKWMQSASQETAGTPYDNVVKGLEQAYKDFQNDLVGTDSFKNFAAMISPTGATDPANFEENYSKAKRYLQEGSDGVKNFLSDLKSKDLATFNQETGEWVIKAHSAAEAAKALATGTDVANTAFGKLEDYGFHINTVDDVQDGILKIGDAYTKLADSKAKLKEMEENPSEYSDTRIQAQKDEVEAYTKDISDLTDNMQYYIKHQADEYSQQRQTAQEAVKQMMEFQQEVEKNPSEYGGVDNALAVSNYLDQQMQGYADTYGFNLNAMKQEAVKAAVEYQEALKNATVENPVKPEFDNSATEEAFDSTVSKVQQGQKEISDAMETLQGFTSDQIKSVDLFDGAYDSAELKPAEQALDTIYQSLGLSKDEASQLGQVLEAMGVVKPEVDDSDIEKAGETADTTSEKVQSLKDLQSSGMINPDIELDFDSADMSADELKSKVDELNGLKAEIDAEVNPEASAELDDLISKTDTDYKIKVALDTDGQTPAQLLEMAQNDEATFKAKFELDDSGYQEAVSYLQSQDVEVKVKSTLEQGADISSLLNMSDEDLSTTLNIDTSQVDEARSELQSIQNGEVTVPLTVQLEENQFSQLTGTKDLQVNVEPHVDAPPTIPDATVKVTPDPEEIEVTVKPADVDVKSSNKEVSVNAKANITSINPTTEETEVNAKANITSINPTSEETEVNAKANITGVTGQDNVEVVINARAKVTGADQQTSEGTVNYKKGSVEKADGTTSQGIINYKKGDVEKADGTVSTGVINYNLGNVATPTGMVATGTINYNLGTVAKPKAMGTMTSIAHISGTLGTRAYAQGSLSDFFFSPTPAHANGNVSLEQNETALVNEVGIESIVRDGRWSLLPGGAHFVNLKKGDIIFSASQTEDLLKRGATPGHARAYAQGSLSDFSLSNAFAGGRGSFYHDTHKSSSSSSSTPSTIPANTSVQKSNTKATNDNTKATKKNTSAFDYVAQRLSYFANKTKAIADKITDYVSSAFKSTQLKKQINAISSEINVNTKAAQAYKKKANSVDLTASQKKAVREGRYSITDYDTSSSGDKKTTYDKLNDYKKYYEEYVKCTQAVQDLKNQQLELFEQWANMPIEEAEKKIERLKNGFKGLTAIQARLNVANLGGSAQSFLKYKMTNVVNSVKSSYNKASTTKKNAKKNYGNAVKSQKSAQTQADKDSKTLKSATSRLKKNKKITLTDTEKRRIASGQTLSTKGLKGTKKTLVQNYNKAVKKKASSQKKLTSAKSTVKSAKNKLDSANANYNKVKPIYDTYTSQYKELTKHINSGNSLDYQNYLVDMEVANARSEDEANQKAYKQAVQNRLNIQKQADVVNPTKIRENAKTKAKKTGSSILKKYSKKLTKSQRNSLKNGTKVNTKGIKDKKLLKQLNAYNKALDNASKKAKNSQEKYNQLSQQLTIAKNKEMEIAATAAESQAEYAQKAIEAEQTKFDNVSQYYNTKIDYEKSLADKSEKARELDSAKGNYTKSSDYNTQISDMQKQQQLQSELAKKLQAQLDKSVKTGKIKKGSDEWLKMRTEIVEAESAVADYNTQIENLKQQQLTTKYEEMFDRAIDKADKFISKLNSIDDLISDDMKYDYETGELTEFGALSIALNAKELDSQIANIKQYAQKRKQIKDDFANGKYGEQKYDELMAENDSSMQSAIKNASNYRDAIVKIITSQAQAVQDALFKVMDARKKALQKKKEYYDYDKQLKNKTSEIQLLDQQIAALDGLTDAESKAMKAKLEAQRKEKQEDLDDTVRDHVYDLQIDGLDDLKDQLSEDFEKWSKELASNLDKTTEVINKAVNSVGNNTAQVMDALAQVLKAYGVEPSDVLTNSDLNKLDGYASGTKRVGGVPRLAMTNEKGREILVTKKGILTPVLPTDGVVPSDMTSTLMQMAMDYKGFEMPEVIMPNIEIVNKGESEGGNVYNHYDSLLTVQGDVTKDALPDLKTILQKASEYTQNDIRKNRRRFG